jgi:threonine aldolase
MKSFASDNYAGIHPDVLSAIAAANEGHAVAYGEDAHTAELTRLIQQEFGPPTTVFPVFNGTGANVVALQAMTKSWEAVICASSAHINADEGGAPEKVAGLKLWLVDSPDGKLTPALIDQQAWGFGFEHRAQPGVVTITQTTEYGTCYTPEEIALITDHAHSLGLFVHMDGARIANAAATLGLPLKAFTADVGIDAVSFGGTKNGAMGAEAVVVLNPELAAALPYLRKTAMQLASKMRFISAQLVALLTDDLWLLNARHANDMAQRLAEEVAKIPGISITQPVQANAVFATMPPAAIEKAQEAYRFYVWDHTTNEVRWMCAWDTTPEDVDAFTRAIREAVEAA